MKTQLEFDFSPAQVDLPSESNKETTSILTETIKWKNSPLSEKWLKCFIQKGILEEEEFPAMENFEFSDYIEDMWLDYAKEHDYYPGELINEHYSYDDCHDDFMHQCEAAYDRLTTAIEELRSQPNMLYPTIEQYYEELWHIYALNSSLKYERPLEYRIFMNACTKWTNSYEHLKLL